MSIGDFIDTVRQVASRVVDAITTPPPPPPPQSTEQVQARANAATSDPEQRALLVEGYTQAQQQGDGALWQQTEDLATLYHDQEILQLSRTLAPGDEAPDGWDKADDAQLAQYGLSAEDLHPEGSGFSAELYIPDPEVYGPDATPVIVFEGTDFADPNDVNADVAQALGSPEEYYNRAMAIATTANEHSGGNISFSGHSLGGGLATAAAQVTGAPAIVSNPAGVHADTTARFLAERGLATPADADAGITTYVVEGDLLTELQDATSGLSADNADAMATDVNIAVQMYNHLTGNALPADATGDQLRDLPDAAGTVVTLDATDEDGNSRGDIIPLGDIIDDVNATADTLSLPGEAVEEGSSILGSILDIPGDVVNWGTDVVGGALEQIDRVVPGNVLTELGNGYQTLGDVVDQISEAPGDLVRDTGRTISEWNRDIAVAIATVDQGLSGDVRDSVTEMVDRHSFPVFDDSLGNEIDAREQALREQLG
jgi:hypothetical protein